jgi:hypothetical protein
MPWSRNQIVAQAALELRDVGTERIDVIELNEAFASGSWGSIRMISGSTATAAPSRSVIRSA